MLMTPKVSGLCHILRRKIKAKSDERCATHDVAHPPAGYLAMKRALLILILLFFILLVLIAFLLTPFDDQIMVITIIIPRNFIPYYDWLLDFPGWRIPQHPEPLPPIPTYYGYQSVTQLHYSMTYLKLVRNIAHI